MGSHCSRWSRAAPSRPGGQEVPHGGDAGPGLGFCQQRWDMEVVLSGDRLGWKEAWEDVGAAGRRVLAGSGEGWRGKES